MTARHHAMVCDALSQLSACLQTIMRLIQRAPLYCLLALIITHATIRVSTAFQLPQRSNRPRTDHNSRRAIPPIFPLPLGVPYTYLQASPVVVPSLSKVAASCLLPTSLGFIKSEYGVSYGYGTSVALLAFSILQQVTPDTIPYYHALALLFYGTRLDLFLLYRELFIPKFRKFRDEIEEKAPSNRLSRAPFIASCALLYACLAAPLFVTSTCTATFSTITEELVACTWIGFILAALGDLQKSIVKATNGEDTLVTGGVFRFLRHPNFTGETLAWTSSFLAAISVGNWRSNAGLLAASALGWAGIVFVLAMASTNLEKKQKEKYGDTPEYQEWVDGSWAGVTLAKKDSS